MRAPQVTRHTSKISSCQKKTFFSFPVAVNNSIKVGPFSFLAINVFNHGEIMNRPVYCVRLKIGNLFVVMASVTLRPFYCEVKKPN